MAGTVRYVLEIDAEWELLNSGAPEEKACFAALGIRSGDIWLSEADDRLVKRTRTAPYLSAYRLAEWLAWNWWRLRWEPRTRAEDWALAHRMATIGGGYVWPNITIYSDGERIVVTAKPTQPTPAEPVRYIANTAVILRAVEFENAIDAFLGQVQGQLRSEGVSETNFDRIWNAVREERNDSEAVRWRKLEAMLGFDPDEADASLVERLITDAETLGQRAVLEIAADHEAGTILTSQQFREMARTSGVASSPADAAQLEPTTRLPIIGQAPAWQRGAEAAKALRAQERLGDGPISDVRLSALAGAPVAVLRGRNGTKGRSFALNESRNTGYIALRARAETGQRFDLARLIGDRIAGSSGGERLLPATGADTYRQKVQRSFAAELLCPFDRLEEVLQGDTSGDAIEDAAQHFNVSERTVRTLLVNHRRLNRDDLEGDPEALMVAEARAGEHPLAPPSRSP